MADDVVCTVELTPSQQMALVDLLLEHVLRPGGTTEVYVDVVRNVETTAIDLLNAVCRHTRYSLAGVDELWLALESLVQLQAHYATLLNMQDGGARRAFASAEEWVARLREMDAQERHGA